MEPSSTIKPVTILICKSPRNIRLWTRSFWTEFSLSRSYWSAAFKNIVGFVTLGFCFYAWWSTSLSPKRAALATIAFGATVSLVIEILQGFLPMRDSGTTDIITNTLGTSFGVVFYCMSLPVLAWFSRLFSRYLHFPISVKEQAN
jgi:glycopeptide antibiotics resistance protein